MATKVSQNNIVKLYSDDPINVDWSDFLINLPIPLNTEMINIIKSLYDKKEFKKIIIDDYWSQSNDVSVNKRLIIHILGNDKLVEYTQYRIKRIVYQIYTVNNLTYIKHYDLYLKKYVSIKYINNFNFIKDFNISNLIEKLDTKLIKEINVIDEHINILYNKITINAKPINQKLYFIKYMYTEIYIEIISSKIEIDILYIFDKLDIPNKIDIDYNYLNIISRRKTEGIRQNRKIIKYDNQIIFDAYYNWHYFNISPFNKNLLVSYVRNENIHDEHKFEQLNMKKNQLVSSIFMKIKFLKMEI